MYFQMNDRLGISVPYLMKEWADYSIQEQEHIIHQWEQIRGSIPDRIQSLEAEINERQAMLEREENFRRSCRLNEEIGELASIINDLWLWFRTTPSVEKEHIC
ncbi:hypothetical protein [Bacillus xiapuensis]|uniref:hypothetical protein n=1 Tax=Bacillus xiapuensis TaxID=2014075 RepID=UPI000C24F32A|nr:hypothetical protein [Bacillus xiapuensis]